MAKNYPHEIRIPRILIDANGVRTTAGNTPLAPPTDKQGRTVASGLFQPIDPSVPNAIHDPSAGSSIIYMVGGNIRARGKGEGE